MQHQNEKTTYLKKLLGETVKKLRKLKTKKSLNTFAHEYSLDPGHISKMENGIIEIKFNTLWKIAEALELPLSELVKEIEKQLPEGFSLVD